MIEQKKYFLKNTIQTSWYIIEKAYADFLNGELSEDDAKIEVVKTIESLRYGSDLKDYFWISNMDTVLIAHPYRKDLVDIESSKLMTPESQELFAEFVRVTEETGETFSFINGSLYGDAENIQPKIAYLKRFKPWGWIIGTGLYLDDIETELKSRTGDVILLLIAMTVIIISMSMYSAFQTYKANKHLIEEELKLQGLFNNSPHFIALLNTDGSIAKVNRTSIEFFNLENYESEK